MEFLLLHFIDLIRFQIGMLFGIFLHEQRFNENFFFNPFLRTVNSEEKKLAKLKCVKGLKCLLANKGSIKLVKLLFMKKNAKSYIRDAASSKKMGALVIWLALSAPLGPTRVS